MKELNSYFVEYFLIIQYLILIFSPAFKIFTLLHVHFVCAYYL